MKPSSARVTSRQAAAKAARCPRRAARSSRAKAASACRRAAAPRAASYSGARISQRPAASAAVCAQRAREAALRGVVGIPQVVGEAGLVGVEQVFLDPQQRHARSGAPARELAHREGGVHARPGEAGGRTELAQQQPAPARRASPARTAASVTV